MSHSASILSALLILARINADSTEEQVFTNFYPPSTVDFHDIYTGNLALLSEDSLTKAAAKEEDYHLNNMHSQFVEFRQRTTKPPPASTVAVTDSDSAENMTETSRKRTSPSPSTIEEYEDSSVKVLPIKKDYQRGVLDLLFPATRVRTFKSIFDTFRRILSHTFRR